MDDFRDFIAGALGILALIFIIFFVLALLFSPIIAASYYSSCRQAEIYNQQHGTKWSCSDFLWAGDQINASTQTINVR